MYPYMYPNAGPVPPCYYWHMASRPSMQPIVHAEKKSMLRGSEESEDRADKGNAMPPMNQPMSGMGQQMPGKMDMSKMDMGKIKSQAEEIINMFEQHHPDFFTTLTGCGMSMGQARQYLSRVTEMTLMHHMMQQM